MPNHTVKERAKQTLKTAMGARSVSGIDNLVALGEMSQKEGEKRKKAIKNRKKKGLFGLLKK